MGIVGGIFRYRRPWQQAANLASRGPGEPIASLRDCRADASLMFDWRELRRWGIDEKLPAERKRRPLPRADSGRAHVEVAWMSVI